MADETAVDPAMASQPAPEPGAEQADAGEEQGDTGPLSSIHIEPAEEGGSVITHEPKAPSRVKAMGIDHLKPRKHVVKSHEEMVEHIKKHGKRLQP